tara:strand:+ start:188 stop:628 length:441 start_codon:yes stop_codon:yes gene_type:complete
MNNYVKYPVAYLSGGCFWHIQEYFSNLDGILDTKVGYMGLKIKPTYEKVCQSNNYTETIMIRYNPKKISYENILIHFFNIHNANKKVNKEQYKSYVYYSNNYQYYVYKTLIKNIKYRNIRTKIIPKIKKTFHIAENYHQHYIKKNK